MPRPDAAGPGRVGRAVPASLPEESATMSLRWMQATGVYLGADCLVAVTVAWSPRGPRIVATQRETVDEGSLAGCLQRWLQEKKLAGRMALGVDPRCAFTI